MMSSKFAEDALLSPSSNEQMQFVTISHNQEKKGKHLT